MTYFTPELEAFLSSMGILDKATYYCETKPLMEDYPHNSLEYSFAWEDTDEGDDFWADLNDEFEHLKNKKI